MGLNAEVVSFSNLRGDAELIAPTPDQDLPLKYYTHLDAFVRQVPVEQIRKLLVKIGNDMEQMMKEMASKKIWLSTSGTGVYWLHVRLDTSPKYYTYKPYARM